MAARRPAVREDTRKNVLPRLGGRRQNAKKLTAREDTQESQAQNGRGGQRGGHPTKSQDSRDPTSQKGHRHASEYVPPTGPMSRRGDHRGVHQGHPAQQRWRPQPQGGKSPWCQTCTGKDNEYRNTWHGREQTPLGRVLRRSERRQKVFRAACGGEWCSFGFLLLWSCDTQVGCFAFVLHKPNTPCFPNAGGYARS